MGGPFFPSSLKAAENFLKLVKPSKKDLLVDLGSGDGRIVIQLAKKGYKIHGMELNPFFVLFSNFLLLATGNISRGRVYWKNVYKVDLSKYNHVYTYLYPKTVNDLSSKFEKELPKGAKVVSNTFKIKKWIETDAIDKFYLYDIDKYRNG
ncbi:MAG TPA: hypothetical protein VGA67_02030 [Candidatus Dojkabacteria bacterium]